MHGIGEGMADYSHGLPVYPPAPGTLHAALAELRSEVAALRERVAVLEAAQSADNEYLAKLSGEA